MGSSRTRARTCVPCIGRRILNHCATREVPIFITIFIYLFLAALGLRCCTRAFSNCSERGLLFVAVLGLLIAVASLVVEHGLWVCGLSNYGSQALECRLSSCGARAYLLCGMWDLPRPGLEPVSPALAGRFLTTVPPGKSLICLIDERQQEGELQAPWGAAVGHLIETLRHPEDN